MQLSFCFISLADIVSNTEVELDDATTSVQSFKSPNYPTGYPSNTKASWGVKSESEWDPVTIMVISFVSL